MALGEGVLVVGAPGEDGSVGGVNGDATNNGAIDSGAGYVFVPVDGEWTQVAYLKAPTPLVDAACGSSVAVYGEFVAVGCPGDSSSGVGTDPAQGETPQAGAGAVVLFRRGPAGYLHHAFLKASNVGAMDQFGASVDISADTIVAGAPGEDGSQSGVNPQLDEALPSAGTAYVH